MMHINDRKPDHYSGIVSALTVVKPCAAAQVSQARGVQEGTLENEGLLIMWQSRTEFVVGL